MKDDSKLFPILALVLILGAGVAVYFIYFNQPGTPPAKPVGNSNETPGKPNVPTVNARDFAPETAGRADPVVSKRPEQPVTLEKALRRMLISGRVSDEGGRALQDVRIEFQGQGELALFRGTGYSDPAGNYTLLAWERSNIRRVQGADSGGWVYAKAPDGRIAASETQKFAFGPTANMADILLTSQAVIEGSVQDANGAPAPFAQVTLRSMGPIRLVDESGGAATYDHRPIARSSVADERGQYSFIGLPRGSYGLTVESGYFGAAPIATEVNAADGGSHWQDLKLTRINTVRGALKDQDGVPIEGAVVLLRQKGSGRPAEGNSLESTGDKNEIKPMSRRDASRGGDFRASAGRWRSVTDAEGRFGFCNIADLELELLAQLGKKSVELGDVRINKDDYTLTLELETSVAGNVRDAATNLPVTRFDVRVYGSNSEPTPFDRVNEEAVFPWHSAGRYRVLNAPEGDIALRVSAPGYAPATIFVKELAAKERRLGADCALKPLCDLMLTLKSGEKLLPREPVFLLYDGRSVGESATDDFGEVRLPGIMAAEYEIRVQRADGSVLNARFSVPAQRAHAATVVLGPK